ncbi:WD40 repeat domain-containing protein [Dactylosporangium sp. CS-033363]|uniref:WD40 repeat domain-containing protein n=1 Tax=Dactylosporangium sp. CS-033363 TaxID=3239935 RepID=UPI003D8FEED7
MRDLFTALPEDPAPPLADGYMQTVLVRGRRSVRRRRLGAAAAWSAVVLILIALFPVVRPEPRPAAPAPQPSVPDRFAAYSTLTATVERAAPGRAIALYTYGNGELFNMHQPLVVGADRDTYRRVGAIEERDRPVSLLSPDGTQVLVGERRGWTTDLLLVDLTTGDRRRVPVHGNGQVRLLAWSPDQRYVAYSEADADSVYASVDDAETNAVMLGLLRIMDLTTGTDIVITSVKQPYTAAFAPDSARIAVQTPQAVHLLNMEGFEDGTVTIPAGQGLVARVAWSPDGRFLATVPWDGNARDDTIYLRDKGPVTFVPLAPTTTAPAPIDHVARPLGWRDADHLIAATTDDHDRPSLTEITVSTGDRRPLSSFDTTQSCEFGTQHCEVSDLQLATALLPNLTVRPAQSPDNGPWPQPLRILAVALPLAFAALVLLMLQRRRRALRRSRSSSLM